jgi:hypothetical protein
MPGSLTLSPAVRGPHGTAVLDDFNRADGAIGNGWVNRDGGPGGEFPISGKVIVAPGEMYLTTAPMSAPCEAFITILTLPSVSDTEFGLLQVADATAGYDIRIVPNLSRVNLQRFDSGFVFSFVGTAPDTYSPGDRYTIGLDGATLTVYKDRGAGWFVLGSAVDPNPPLVGPFEFYIYSDAAGTASFDNAGGGPLLLASRTTASLTLGGRTFGSFVEAICSPTTICGTVICGGTALDGRSPVSGTLTGRTPGALTLTPNP